MKRRAFLAGLLALPAGVLVACGVKPERLSANQWAELEAEADRRAGRVARFSNVEDLIDDLYDGFGVVGDPVRFISLGDGGWESATDPHDLFRVTGTTTITSVGGPRPRIPDFRLGGGTSLSIPGAVQISTDTWRVMSRKAK